MMYLYKEQVAEELRESGLLNDCNSFNQVMACYAADGQFRKCCELFHEMLVERKTIFTLDWGTFKTLFTLLKKSGLPSKAEDELQTAYNGAKPLTTPAVTATLLSAIGLCAGVVLRAQKKKKSLSILLQCSYIHVWCIWRHWHGIYENTGKGG